MEKQFLKYLIDKFYAGTISENERKQLDHWYQSFNNDKGYTDGLTHTEKTDLESSILNRINTKIEAHEGTKPAKKSRMAYFKFKPDSIYPTYLKVAAVFVMAVTVTALAYTFLNQSVVSHTTGYGQISHITLPDHSTIILYGNS